MRNGNNCVEIVIHIDDSLGDGRRSDLKSILTERDGIYSAEFCSLRDHLMLVEYDSSQLSSLDVLQLVKRGDVTAQLIGPI